MRVVVGLVLSVLSWCVVSAVQPADNDCLFVTSDLKRKQILIFNLLNHVTEPIMYEDIEDIGSTFDIGQNMGLFTNSETVKDFVKVLKTGLLPRGEVFTLHVDRHLKEAIMMFHLLYSAKDFTTFMKTACWMRLNLNEGMFVYALSVAIRHREDCKGIVLPPPYEIYPYHFVRADVIQKAYKYKMRNDQLDPKLSHLNDTQNPEQYVFIIDENIYDSRVYLNKEDKLRYFTEDIDLSTYYYNFNMDYPFWMKDHIFDESKVRRFELMVYMYQQILARYYLERLSNDLGPVEELSWYKPIKNGYWPWLIMHNGVEAPVRFNNFVIYRDNINIVEMLENYETIITEAIVKGYIDIDGRRLELRKPEDVEVLGKLLYSTTDSTNVDRTHVHAYRFFPILANAAIGLNTLVECDSYFVNPTVLDYHQTTLRDPVFYQLQKRIVGFTNLFKNQLRKYTYEELNFSGVKIDSVTVDRLETYFDYYIMDMTNAITLSKKELKKSETNMRFFVRKRRLNHQPFNITIDILSDKSTDSVVRIFLGPKEDHSGNLIDINRNRLNFVEIDSFLYKLSKGKNAIVRNSAKMHNLIPDRIKTSNIVSTLKLSADMSDFGNKLKNYHTGFPTRLLLPKGRVGGLKMWLYVIVTPFNGMDKMYSSNDVRSEKNSFEDFRFTVLLDKLPLGFPLDRQIDVSTFFTPNMKFADAIVFHKEQECDMKTRWEQWVLKDYDMGDSIMTN